MAFLFPELAEPINRVWGEAGVVIVCIGIDGDAAMTDFETEVNPAHELRRAVDDGLVPFHGDAFDPFTVAEPADVGSVGGYRVEFALQFIGYVHGGEVLEDEGNYI